MALVLLLLAACTRNHGDIGIWFGTWHVNSITVGGTPATVQGNYFFQFQNRVFRVSMVGAHEQQVESYGTWEENEDGTRLTITFPDPDVFYIDMPGLEARNEFVVNKIASNRLELYKVLDDGTPCTFILNKQP